MGIGVFIGILLPALFTGPEIWKSYIDAMGDHPHQITTAYKFGNSEFDGKSMDLQRSSLLEDPPIYSVSATFFRNNSDFIDQIIAPLSEFSQLLLGHLHPPKKIEILGAVIYNSLSKSTQWLGAFFIVLFMLLLVKGFQRPLFINNASNSILFLIGAGLFVLSNYFLCINHSYTNVLWILPIALIIIHSNSFLYFARTSLLPVSFFLFFTAIGWNWFPVPGLGLMLGQFVLSTSLPFIILDLLQRP